MSKSRLIRQNIAVVLLLSLTAACGPLVNLSPGGSPLTYYSLTPANNFDSAPEAQPIILLVERPVAPGHLDTPHIALKPSSLEVQYFAKVKWADQAPRMIQNLLVTSFENAASLKSVGTEAMSIPADFRLKMTLRDLQADYPAPDAAPLIHVTFSLKLISKIPMMTVNSKVITASAQAKHNKMPDIMAAFDKATGEALKETVIWTMTSTAGKGAPAP
jgi:cholesterol transport system auxiliary component